MGISFCVNSQISFHEFKYKLLEPGHVDRIIVANAEVATVYVRNSSPCNNQTCDDTVQGLKSGADGSRNLSHHKYYFNIGSVELFEQKLKEAQEASGIDPRNYVPVIYVNQLDWLPDMMKFGAMILIPAIFYYMDWGGVREIFSIGKPRFMKMDKNAENKVRISSRYWCSSE